MKMETDSINGWTPPVIYDPSTDRSRIATQEDFDRLLRSMSTLAPLVYQIRKLIADADAYLKSADVR